MALMGSWRRKAIVASASAPAAATANQIRILPSFICILRDQSLQRVILPNAAALRNPNPANRVLF
jgi:hypothetical protein